MNNQQFQQSINNSGNAMDPQSFQSLTHNTGPINQISRPTSSKALIFGGTVFFVITIISLVLSIINAIQINNINSILADSDATEIEEDQVSFEETAELPCNLPSSIQDIEYFYAYYDKGENSFFIDSDNHISVYSNKTSESGQTTNNNISVTTNTDEILQTLFDAGLSDFSSYAVPSYDEEDSDNNSTNSNWKAQIDMADSSSCEAKGDNDPPMWLNDIINKVNKAIVKE